MINTFEIIPIFERFDEGTEITDAVQALVSAANTLYGINRTHEAKLAIVLAENLIVDYMEWELDNHCEHELEKIDPSVREYVFSHKHGKAIDNC
jgi:hypothetical protein